MKVEGLAEPVTRYFFVRLMPAAARSIKRRSISDREGRSGSDFRNSSIVAFSSGVRRIWSVSTCFIPQGISGLGAFVNNDDVVTNVRFVSNVLTNNTRKSTSISGHKPTAR